MLTEWAGGLSAAGMLGGGGGGGGAGRAGGGDGKGKPFSLLSFLSSEGQLLRWKSQGLPSDKLSSENAIVILNAPQPPLIIDPSSQATGWLKTYLQALTPTLAPAPTLAPSPTLTLTLTPTLTCFDDVALAGMLAAGLRPGTRVVTVDSMLPNR